MRELSTELSSRLYSAFITTIRSNTRLRIALQCMSIKSSKR